MSVKSEREERVAEFVKEMEAAGFDPKHQATIIDTYININGSTMVMGYDENEEMYVISFWYEGEFDACPAFQGECDSAKAWFAGYMYSDSQDK